MNFEDLEVEVNSYKKNNLRASQQSIGDTTDLESENEYSNLKNKKHDAMVIEYCPRIFRELREMDEYDASELDM